MITLAHASGSESASGCEVLEVSHCKFLISPQGDLQVLADANVLPDGQWEKLKI